MAIQVQEGRYPYVKNLQIPLRTRDMNTPGDITLIPSRGDYIYVCSVGSLVNLCLCSYKEKKDMKSTL